MAPIKFNLLLGMFLCMSGFSQGFVSADPDTASVPCSNCPGASWNITSNPSPITQYPFSISSIILAPDSFSQTLHLYDYDLVIPASAQVTGCELILIRTAGGGSFICDSTLHLTHLGQTVGNNKRNPIPWTQPSDTLTYGGPTDTWGFNLTAAMVNNREIGIAFSFRATNYTLTIQQARLRVYYQMPMSTELQENERMYLLPNPAQTSIQCKSESNTSHLPFVISDAKGKILRQGFTSSPSTPIYIGDLPNGVYYFTPGINAPIPFIKSH